MSGIFMSDLFGGKHMDNGLGQDAFTEAATTATTAATTATTAVTPHTATPLPSAKGPISSILPSMGPSQYGAQPQYGQPSYAVPATDNTMTYVLVGGGALALVAIAVAVSGRRRAPVTANRRRMRRNRRRSRR